MRRISNDVAFGTTGLLVVRGVREIVGVGDDSPVGRGIVDVDGRLCGRGRN